MSLSTSLISMASASTTASTVQTTGPSRICARQANSTISTHPVVGVYLRLRISNLRVRDALTPVRAPLMPADDDEALSRQPNASLGEIAVQVRRIIVNDRYQRPHPVPGVALFTGKVHERSKKAGVHSVGYVCHSPHLPRS
jgi:hypothetical protein